VKVRLRNPVREVELAGARTIHDVLGELQIDPDTVLVIRERELLTRGDRVADEDVIEVRPVISGGGGPKRMKCRRCKAPAIVELRRHNAAFCRDCFLRHVRQQVRRAIEGYDMLEPSDRVLVAVSGGKDSLALWDVLLDLGYRPMACTWGWASAGTRRGHDVVRAFATSARPTWSMSTWRATTASTSRRPAEKARVRPAPCVGCRSGTCSTGRRARAGTT
jgi:tRNA-5-methyluridine54 2-sulfurtransferase